MSFLQHGMPLPLFGITYGVTGIVSGAWWLRQVHSRALLALSGVIVAMAALNAYVENWAMFERTRPDYTICLLLAIFLLPYATLSIRLMEQMEGMTWRPAIWSSYLPLVFLLLIGLAMAIGPGGSTDNRPIALFIGVALVCVLHVPMFAYGKGDVVKIMRSSGISGAGISKMLPEILKQAIAGLAMPILITLGIQVAMRDDWELFGINVVMTVAILSLFLISRGTRN